MSRPFVIELTEEELTIAWNAMEYAHDAFDSDMSLMDEGSQAEIRKLYELKMRFEQMIENAQQGRTEGNA